MHCANNNWAVYIVYTVSYRVKSKWIWLVRFHSFSRKHREIALRTTKDHTVITRMATSTDTSAWKEKETQLQLSQHWVPLCTFTPSPVAIDIKEGGKEAARAHKNYYKATIIYNNPSLPRCLIESNVSVGRVPGGAKDIERLGEDIVVDKTSVDREQTHQENNVATVKYRTEHLKVKAN